MKSSTACARDGRRKQSETPTRNIAISKIQAKLQKPNERFDPSPSSKHASKTKDTAASADAGTSARERLLDAAERLFADFGFNGVSVRQIVASANVNLSGVPYYFGTKENLFKSVLMRRALPMRERRRKEIAELYARDPKPSLEDVLYVLLEPAFRANRENEYFRKLLGRASMDPVPEVRALLDEIYNADFMVVPRELRRSLAAMPAQEFFWKLNCFYGVMLFVQADTGKIQTIAGADFDTSRPDVALKFVVPFLAAGFRAAVGKTAAGKAGKSKRAVKK